MINAFALKKSHNLLMKEMFLKYLKKSYKILQSSKTEKVLSKILLESANFTFIIWSNLKPEHEISKINLIN